MYHVIVIFLSDDMAKIVLKLCETCNASTLLYTSAGDVRPLSYYGTARLFDSFVLRRSKNEGTSFIISHQQSYTTVRDKFYKHFTHPECEWFYPYEGWSKSPCNHLLSLHMGAFIYTKVLVSTSSMNPCLPYHVTWAVLHA